MINLRRFGLYVAVATVAVASSQRLGFAAEGGGSVGYGAPGITSAGGRAFLAVRQNAVLDAIAHGAMWVCSYHCNPCSGADSQQWTYAGLGAGEYVDEGDTGCVSVACPNVITDCNGDDDLIQSVAELAAQGNAIELEGIVERSSKVHINADRHALQVQGCDGSIAASIPITASLEAALHH